MKINLKNNILMGLASAASIIHIILAGFQGQFDLIAVLLFLITAIYWLEFFREKYKL